MATAHKITGKATVAMPSVVSVLDDLKVVELVHYSARNRECRNRYCKNSSEEQEVYGEHDHFDAFGELLRHVNRRWHELAAW